MLFLPYVHSYVFWYCGVCMQCEVCVCVWGGVSIFVEELGVNKSVKGLLIMFILGCDCL